MPESEVQALGIGEVREGARDQACSPINYLVEKPSPKAVPPTLAITGRYVLTSDVFELLEHTAPGADDGLQLTDAVRGLDSVRGVELNGHRPGIGNISSRVRANVEMAMQYDDGDMNGEVL